MVERKSQVKKSRWWLFRFDSSKLLSASYRLLSFHTDILHNTGWLSLINEKSIVFQKIDFSSFDWPTHQQIFTKKSNLSYHSFFLITPSHPTCPSTIELMPTSTSGSTTQLYVLPVVQAELISNCVLETQLDDRRNGSPQDRLLPSPARSPPQGKRLLRQRRRPSSNQHWRERLSPRPRPQVPRRRQSRRWLGRPHQARRREGSIFHHIPSNELARRVLQGSQVRWYPPPRIPLLRWVVMQIDPGWARCQLSPAWRLLQRHQSLEEIQLDVSPSASPHP